MNNLWGDLLSRWITLLTSKKAVMVLGPLSEIHILEDDRSNNGNSLPTVDIIKGIQQQYLAELGEPQCQFPSLFSILGDILIQRAPGGEYVIYPDGPLWIPAGAADLKLRLMVSAHCGEVGHHGRAATLARLVPSCYWTSMKGDVEELYEIASTV